MGSKGSQTISTSQTYTPNPAIDRASNLAISRATDAASQPFQLPVAPVAGLTGDQQAAFEGVRGAQGMASPYFDSARDLATRSAAPISEADVQNYYNPFARNVFDNLAETFGRQTRDVTGRLTNAAGGVGADRIAVGQAELARQQGLAAGQTAAGLYLPALQAAQNEKQRQAQGAFAMGSLGPAAQAAALQGSGALLNVGGLQQQQRQAEMMAPYQNRVAELAYPFQTAQYLAGITGGLAPSLGGTTQGTQTKPGPSALSQILGAGMGLAGLGGQLGAFGGMGGGSGKGSGASPYSYMGGADPSGMLIYGPGFRYGGRVRRADGGPVDDVVPEIDIKPGPFPMPIPMPSGGGGGSAGAPGGGGGGGDQPEWMKYAAMAAKFVPMLFGGPPLPMSAGGRARNFDGYNPFAFGGTVTPFDAGQGFADGGDVVDLEPGADGSFSFNDRFAPAVAAIESGAFDPRGANFTTGQPFVPVPRPRPAGLGGDESGFIPSQQPAGGQAFAQMPRRPQLVPVEPEIEPTAFAEPNERGTPFAAPQRDAAGDMARSPWAALAAAGFGMLAGDSPFAGVNIGKGALEGIKVLERQRQAGTQERRVDLEAKRLMQQAEQFTKSHGLKERSLDETVRQHDIQMMAPVKIGMDEVGRDVYARRDPKSGRYLRIDPKSGQLWEGTGALPPNLSGAQGTPPAPPLAVPTAVAATDDAALPPGARPAEGEQPKELRKEVLQGLEPQIAGQVIALSEGRMPFPSGNALRTPYWQNMMRMVTQYDPSFDAVNYNARAQTRKNFATGVEARNVTALNTVMGHLDTLDQAGEALQNFASDRFGPLSKKANEFRTWYLSNKQDPRVKNFETAAEAVSNELERAFRGSTTAIAGIRSWREKMNPAMSPQEMKDANKTLTKLLASRIDAMGDQYNRGMGTTKDPMTLLSPDAQATFKRLAKGEKVSEGPKFTGRTASGPGGQKLRETTDGKWVP